MARQKKEESVDNSTNETGYDILEVLGSHLKQNKDKHLNFNRLDTPTIVSSGSIVLDTQLNGGLRPGVHSMNGSSGGGKSSSCLSFMEEFLKFPNRRAIYFQAERLLSEQHKSRTGINYVDDYKDWKDGTCYLYNGNVFEDIITLIRTLVSNANGTQFMFVIDSVNALIPEADLDRSFSEANKVAGGALLSSDFLRRMSLRFSVSGHYCFLIGQVRTSIKINPYEKVAPKLSNASGSYAVDHYSDYIMEFQKSFGGDFIYKDAAKTVALGKWAKVILRKTNSENNEGDTIKYPLKFNQKGKNSIWKEYEILTMLLAWHKMNKSGAWITPSEDFLADLKEQGFEFPEKFQEKSILDWLEEHTEVTDYLFNKCKNLAIDGSFN